MLASNPKRKSFLLKPLAVGIAALLLTACNTTQQVPNAEALQQKPVNLVKVNQKPNILFEEQDKEEDKKRVGRTLIEHRGTGTFVNTPATNAVKRAAPGEGVNVNFEAAPLQDVLGAIMGDLLKVPYSLEGDVQGQVTLVSTQPVPQDALLDMLESTLEAQGIAMVKGANGIYRIGNSDKLRSEVPVALREAVSTRGYSVRVIPLRYLSATEAVKVLTPLGLKDNILNVDPVRNILMIGASAPQMQNALRTLNMLDVDVLRGMSFGVYEVVNLDAAKLVDRLNNILLNPELGSLASTAKVVPLDEINSIMVVAPNNNQLNSISQWLKKLDQVGLDDDEIGGSQLYVYRVQNGDATSIASLLGQVFGETTDTSASSTSGTTAPGLSSTSLSSEGAESSGFSSSSSSANSSKNMVSSTTAGGTRIVADELNNSLLIMATAKEWRVIRSALDKLDQVPAQVLVEVSIWEVTLKDELNYGVEWFFNSRGGVEGLADRGGLLSLNESGGVARSVPGFSYMFSGSDWRAVINMLASKSNVRSLSSPSVLVLDNKEATIQVGNQQPIQTSGTVNTNNDNGIVSQNFELKDTGVQLKVRPRVNAGGLVVMDIMQEVTDVGPIDTGATGQRSFLKRSIESSVAIQGGDTIILGGLIQDNQRNSDSGIPFLHKLPVVGALFGSKGNADGRTELLITISPRAVNKYQDFTKIGDEFRDKMQNITESFREEMKHN